MRLRKPRFKEKMTLRFNLGRGVNYMKWKITTKIPNENIYLDPDDVVLELVNCKLYNNKNEADKIFGGGHKRVCSWIECDDILVLSYEPAAERYGENVHYNPRIKPHWFNESGEDLDGATFNRLITKKNKVYIKNELD